MILTVILSIICIIFVLPFHLSIKALISQTEQSFKLTFDYVHMFFLAVSMDPISQSVSLSFLGRKLMNKKGATEEDGKGDESRKDTDASVLMPTDQPKEILKSKAPEKKPESEGEKEFEESEVDKNESIVNETPAPKKSEIKEADIIEEPLFTKKESENLHTPHEKKRDKSEKKASKSTRPLLQNGKKISWLERLRNSRAAFFYNQKTLRRKLIRWLVRFLKSFLHLVKIQKLMVYSKAGVEDPAQMGKIYGGFQALYGTLALDRRRFDIRFVPVFMQNYIEIDSCIVIRTSMVQLLTPLILALITFPYLSTFFVWLRYRRLIKKMERT